MFLFLLHLILLDHATLSIECLLDIVHNYDHRLSLFNCYIVLWRKASYIEVILSNLCSVSWKILILDIYNKRCFSESASKIQNNENLHPEWV